MADRVETVVLLSDAEINRRAAEERQRAIEAGELKELDTCIPGGLYKSADGRWHDAHGRELGSESGELASDKQYEMPPAYTMQIGGPEVTDAVKEGADPEDDAWRSDMKDQRRESMANPVEGAPVFGDTVLPPLEDEEEETDAEGKKTGRKVKRARRSRGK
jgi:hypothetical protein